MMSTNLLMVLLTTTLPLLNGFGSSWTDWCSYPLPAISYSCDVIQRIIAQDTSVQPVWILRLNRMDVLIEFQSKVNVEVMLHHLLLRMDRWMGWPCKISCTIPIEEQLKDHCTYEWGPPDNDPGWIHDACRGRLGRADRVGLLQPENQGLHKLFTEFHNSNENQRECPQSPPDPVYLVVYYVRGRWSGVRSHTTDDPLKLKASKTTTRKLCSKKGWWGLYEASPLTWFGTWALWPQLQKYLSTWTRFKAWLPVLMSSFRTFFKLQQQNGESIQLCYMTRGPIEQH